MLWEIWTYNDSEYLYYYELCLEEGGWPYIYTNFPNPGTLVACEA